MEPINDRLLAEILEKIAGSEELWSDFQALCRLGGRFPGTESERQARDLLADRLRAAGVADAGLFASTYTGWLADLVRCEVEGIGSVENPVIDWSDVVAVDRFELD